MFVVVKGILVLVAVVVKGVLEGILEGVRSPLIGVDSLEYKMPSLIFLK